MSSKKEIKRRDFVKSASAAVIGAPYIVPSSVFGANAPSNRLTVGCIGVGGMGSGNLRNFLRRDGVQVLAVCDVDRNRRQRARKTAEEAYARKQPSGTYKGCDDYNDFREIIDRKDIDMVSEALPYHWKAIVTLAAANAGKDIFGEKPVGHSITDGRAMVEAVKRNGIVWQTGMQQRSSDHFRFACELVLNGRIGKLHTIHARLVSRAKDRETQVTMTPEERAAFGKNFSNLNREEGIYQDVTNILQPVMPVPEGFDYDMWLGPAPWSPYTEKRCLFNFRFNYDYGGGRLADWGVHHCDIGHWAMGMEHSGPVEIEGNGEFPREGIWNTAITYKCKCTYANGVTMHVYDVAQPDCAVFFEGTEGTVLVGRSQGVITEPKSLVTSIIRRNEIHLNKSLDHVGNFIDCVRSREEPVAPIEDGHRATSIASLCNIAIQLERKVKWDPERERFINDPEADRMLKRPYRSPWYLP